MMSGGWSMTGWGWAWMAIGFGAMLAFWGVVAWAIVHLVRNASWGSPRHYLPEDELAQRFARGDIDADEYRERRAALRGDGDRSRR